MLCIFLILFNCLCWFVHYLNTGGEVECGLPIALTVEDEEAYATFLTLPESEYGIVDASNNAGSAASPPPAAGTFYHCNM